MNQRRKCNRVSKIIIRASIATYSSTECSHTQRGATPLIIYSMYMCARKATFTRGHWQKMPFHVVVVNF